MKCIPREGNKYVCCGDVIGHTCPLFISRSMNLRMCVSVVKNSHVCHGMDLHVTGTDLSCSCSGVYCMDTTRRDKHEGTKGSSPGREDNPLLHTDAFNELIENLKEKNTTWNKTTFNYERPVTRSLFMEENSDGDR